MYLASFINICSSVASFPQLYPCNLNVLVEFSVSHPVHEISKNGGKKIKSRLMLVKMHFFGEGQKHSAKSC